MAAIESLPAVARDEVRAGLGRLRSMVAETDIGDLALPLMRDQLWLVGWTADAIGAPHRA